MGSLPCVHPSTWTLLDASRGWRFAHPDFPVILFFFFPTAFVTTNLRSIAGFQQGCLPRDAFLLFWGGELKSCQSLHSNWSHLRCLREIPWNVWYVGGIFFQFWTMTDLPHHYLYLPVSVGVWRGTGRLRSSMWWFKCMSQNEPCPCPYYLKICAPRPLGLWDVYPCSYSWPLCLGAQSSFFCISNMLPF